MVLDNRAASVIDFVTEKRPLKVYIRSGLINEITFFDLSNTIADEIKKFLVIFILSFGSIFESPKNEIKDLLKKVDFNSEIEKVSLPEGEYKVTITLEKVNE